MNTDDVRNQAAMQVDARIGFYVHLVVFVAVNALLWFINNAGGRNGRRSAGLWDLSVTVSLCMSGSGEVVLQGFVSG